MHPQSLHLSVSTSRSSDDRPFRALLKAIIDDLFHVRDAGALTGSRRKQLARDLAWVTSGDSGVFSFIWVCDQLGFDADGVRARYLRASPHQRRQTPASAPAAPRQ